MSPTTARIDGSQHTGTTEPNAPRLSASRRIATAGLLALSMMIPLGADAVPEVRQLIRVAQSQAKVIHTDLGEADTHLESLPAALRTEVAEALDSARAATDEARTALAQATTDTSGISALALADAQVALDAAFAHVRYVTDLTAVSNADASHSLLRLQDHLGALRGETDRAVAV